MNERFTSSGSEHSISASSARSSSASFSFGTTGKASGSGDPHRNSLSVYIHLSAKELNRKYAGRYLT